MATYTGTAGNNALTGTSAGDTFVWSAGADTITGGGGFDRLDYRTFTLAITADFAATAYTGTVIKSGGNGTDTFTGIQTILGGSGNDTLSGSTDATPGLPAAVNMQGGAGNDVIDGRSSQLNLVMYSDATSGVTLNMATGTATGGGVGTDSLVDVRRAEGSGFNDTMTGSAFNDTFNHSGGSDTYDGGAGFNLMNYSRGTAFSVTVTALAPGAGLFGLPNETVVKSFGGTDSLANFNLITGSAGADTFLGVITNYTFLSYGFRPGFGNDTINGQSSTINRADYSDALGAVTVDLEAGTALAGAHGIDTLVNVRSVGGSAFNDTLLGSSANDTFRVGGLGIHTVDGRAGGNSIVFNGNEAVTVDLGTVAAAGGFGGFEGTITKGAGADIIRNIASITTTDADDTLRGSVADNFMGGGGGNNLIDGRDGSDTYTLRSWTTTAPVQGATINLGDGVSGFALNAWGGTDTLVSIENARGSHLNDTITGANGAAISFISGEGGNDQLWAPVIGTMVTADYASSISRVVVNLSSGVTTDDGWFGGTDTLVNIERVRASSFNDLVFGNAAANTITARAGNDEIYGLDGADSLLGDDGDDSLYGGADADSLTGGSGADRMDGGDGNDTIRGETENDIIIGGVGEDLLLGGAGIDVILGGLGGDVVYGDEDEDYVYGDDGDDYVYGGAGNDWVYGGVGRDYLYGEDGSDFLFGGAGNDIILAGSGVDVLFGEAGVDVMFGQEGGDYLYGAEDADYLYGDDGDDFVYGGAGNDWVYGGAGLDYLYGDDGSDFVFGGAGTDYILGGGGVDVLFGEAGVDVMFGQEDGDYLYGGEDADYLYGDGGEDSLYGGLGNDFIYGGAGTDFIFGEEGVDYIFGEGGNDVIRGGLGGPDVFYHTAVTDGHDVVVDFEARSDVLVLFGTSYGSYQGALAGAYFDGANLVFNTGNGSSMTLLNTTASAFTPDTLFIV